MANIDGGALSFKSVMENDQMNGAIEETLRRIQGLSDATVAGSKQMDTAFLQTSASIREALSQIGAVCEMHESQLSSLEQEYAQLGASLNSAVTAGDGKETSAIQEKMYAIKGEIEMRKQAIAEARELSNILEEQAQKHETNTQAIENNTNAHQSLRQKIKEVKEEMASLISEGISEQSEAYKALANELGRLQDIQGDISAQGSILANDEAKFQGVIQGLSGLSGAFSAATGAISLFGGENEELQAIMVRVQSVMAIATGMQQVAQTLNKDSAFQLVTLNGLKEWWAGIVAKATIAETAETAATVANTAAQQAQTAVATQNSIAQGTNTLATEGQTIAATTGAVANLTLAGAFRAVGLAIKSIPVFGWIITAITALVGVISHFVSEANKADEEMKQMQETFAEARKTYGKATLELNYYREAVQRFNGTKKEEQRIVEELNSKYGNALGKYNTLSQWKSILAKKGDAYCNVLLREAEAQAILTKYIEAYLAVQNAKDQQANYNKKGFFGKMWDNIKNGRTGEKKAYQEELNKATAEADKFMTLYKKKLKEKSSLENQFGISLPSANHENKKIGISASPKTTSKSTDKKDPFVELLEKRKAEYERFKKWVNSGDDVLVKSASTEFKGLLAQGATYIDFLKKQRDIILSVDVENRSKEQIKRLRTLNDQIAEETKKTVLEAFNEELATQLGNAKTTLDILNIIAQKRKELSGDGTEVDNDKKQALDDAEKNALQKQQEETQKLLDDYASFLDKKIKLDLEYSNDLALLEKARAKATTDEERQKIDSAFANRKSKYDKDSKFSGDSEYDQMLQTYRTFEQKKEDIIEEFSEKRKKAQEHGNTEMLAQLDKAQNEALSKLAIDEMKISPDWEKMFGNLDEVGTKELERLLEMIEGKTAVLGIELSPEDFKVIQDKVKELKNEIKERNPFKALTKGFEDLKNATSDQDKIAALAGMFDSAGKAGDQLKDIISDVTNTLEALGVEGTEEIGHAVQALDGLASGAQDAIMGYMLDNPVQMVGGAIKAIGSVVNYFAGANDRRAERAIKKHQENVKNLTSAYKELEWQISKSMGTSKYKNQQEAIENMKQQQQALDGMIQAEKKKKKSDSAKIKEWEERKKELDRSIVDTIDGMRDDILGTDAKAIATQLGDALVDAFSRGEDASKAWGNTVKDIMNNMVKNIITQKVLYDPISNMAKKFTSRFVNDKGKFLGYDAVERSLDDFEKEFKGLYPSLERSVNALKERLNLSELDNDASLTGAVKGVTEETASIVAGQLNAIRINQGEANNMLRQQLSVLSEIALNTSYNRHLEKLDGILSALTGQQNDPLRSQGLQ